MAWLYIINSARLTVAERESVRTNSARLSTSLTDSLISFIALLLLPSFYDRQQWLCSIVSTLICFCFSWVFKRLTGLKYYSTGNPLTATNYLFLYNLDRNTYILGNKALLVLWCVMIYSLVIFAFCVVVIPGFYTC